MFNELIGDCLFFIWKMPKGSIYSFAWIASRITPNMAVMNYE